MRIEQKLAESMEISEGQEKETAGQRRKKIWQIHSGYHCSVIGTCLNRRDLKLIARKKVFGLESGIDAFAVHRSLSSIATERKTKSRALNKLLDNKFRATIKRYGALGDDTEVLLEWKKDLKDGGAIAGAYWAIMTLPSCAKELLNEVYGDCHMASFDIFSSYADNSKKIASLSKQLEKVQGSLERTKSAYEKEREAVRWELRELQKSKGEFLRQRLINEQLVKENRELKNKLELQGESAEAISLRDELEIVKSENKQLRQAMNQIEEQAGFTQETLEVELNGQRILNRELEEELISMEEMFQLGMSSKKVCDSCEEKELALCEGIGLSGKVVLYVGGRHNMVAHYREMVEKYGGTFLHHDGGKESSRNLLPKMLSGADAVLCPIDCVSHDACKCVKKMCKRSSKPFVMMRSAGLSSLAKGLEMIIQ